MACIFDIRNISVTTNISVASTVSVAHNISDDTPEGYKYTPYRYEYTPYRYKYTPQGYIPTRGMHSQAHTHAY